MWETKLNVAADAADEVQSLAAELAESQWHRADAERSERRLSSLVWIVSSANGQLWWPRPWLLPSEIHFRVALHRQNLGFPLQSPLGREVVLGFFRAPTGTAVMDGALMLSLYRFDFQSGH